jgi:HlyD family secretion protein
VSQAEAGETGEPAQASNIMKKLILIVILLAAVGAGAGAFYMRRDTREPDVRIAQVSRGDIVDLIQATGTLEAVTTVEVGTQVGGIIQELYADFNSIVKKGQVIARLDPTLLQTQIEQQRANVIRSEADLERLKVSLADSKQKLERAKLLFEKNLLPRTELETAEVTVRSAEAQIKSAEAGLTQARSQLNTAEVNLAHTVIAAPIDGIVISRAVEPGQTVNAGMSAPTLFILAADLTKMQVNANIDEADVGRMRPGQAVTFRVDAFPTETFTGAVAQVRLQPTTVQNVVTYQTVINVPNQQLKLKPGMTANVSIEVARRTNVLRIPSAATRFRPTPDVFAALGQQAPADGRGGGGNAAARGGAAEQRGTGANGAAPGGADSRRSVSQSVTVAAAQRGRVAAVPSISGGATTIDSLFGPLPTVETRGRAWLYVNKQLKPVSLRLGISDGVNTEVLDGGQLAQGVEVVTTVILPTAAQASSTTGGAQNPLMGPQRGAPGAGRAGAGGGRGF